MLALVAGQGKLPTLLAERTQPGRILALDGFPPDTILPDQSFRIETLGTLIADLVTAKVDRIVFAGAIRRPPLDPSRIDPATMPLVPKMMAALQSGDDAALRIVLSFFEDAGIEVVGAQQILPELLPSTGCLTTRQPDESHGKDLARARDVIAAIGAADIGQGTVIRSGQVLAVEGTFGTDWMLDSLSTRPDDGGGLFYKAPKPDQDRRIDMPTIGLETVRRAAEAGLDGISIEAGGVFVLDVDACVQAANEANLFIEVVSA